MATQEMYNDGSVNPAGDRTYERQDYAGGQKQHGGIVQEIKGVLGGHKAGTTGTTDPYSTTPTTGNTYGTGTTYGTTGTDQYATSPTGKKPIAETIKEKLPGHHATQPTTNTTDPYHYPASDTQAPVTGEKKPGIVEKVMDMLPGHKAKHTGDTYETTGATGTHTGGLGAGGVTTASDPYATTHTTGHHTTSGVVASPLTGHNTTYGGVASPHTTTYGGVASPHTTTSTLPGHHTTAGTTAYDPLVPVNERHHGLEAAAGGDRYAAGYLPGEEVGVGGEVRKGIMPTIKGLFSKNKTGANEETDVAGVRHADHVHGDHVGTTAVGTGHQHGTGIIPAAVGTGHQHGPGILPSTAGTGHQHGTGIIPKAENALAMGKHTYDPAYGTGAGGYGTAGIAPGGVGHTEGSTPVAYSMAPAVATHVGQGSGYEQTAGGYQQTGLGGQQKEGVIPKVKEALGMGPKHTDNSAYPSGTGAYDHSQGVGSHPPKERIVPKVEHALGLGPKHTATSPTYDSGAGGVPTSMQHEMGIGGQQYNSAGVTSGGLHSIGHDHAEAPGGLVADISRDAHGMVADIKVFIDNSLPTSGKTGVTHQSHTPVGNAQY